MTTLLKLVIAALVPLILLVAGKFFFEHHFAPTTSGIQGELHEEKIDTVLIGSSHTRQSYDMDALEKATGTRAFAIAYDGLDMQGMLPIVKSICAVSAARPKVLVIEAYSANLARHAKLEDPRLYSDAPPRMKLALLHNYLRTHHGLNAYLDLWALASNRGNDLILTYPIVHHALDQLSYRGGYQGKYVSGMSTERFARSSIPVTSDEPDGDQLLAFHAIVATARSAQVALILADPPMPAPVENLPEITALRQTFIALAAAEHIPYFDGAANFPIHNPSLFHDSNHLSTAGRALYTASFADFLRHNTNTSRR